MDKRDSSRGTAREGEKERCSQRYVTLLVGRLTGPTDRQTRNKQTFLPLTGTSPAAHSYLAIYLSTYPTYCVNQKRGKTIY